MYDFNGKTAVVSGAATGIGRAVALRLAKEGADLAVFDLPDRETGEAGEELLQTASEIRGMGRRCSVHLTDVSSPENVKKSFGEVLQEYGQIDFLVNVAGIADNTLPFEKVEADILDKVYEVNVRGTFNMDKEAVTLFKKQRSGKIINFSSINGITGYAGPYAYNASKFAVTGLTQTLAREMGPYGVTVNCICPGFIWTKMWEKNDRALWEEQYPDQEYIPMTFYQKQCDTTCLKRATYPEDVANAVAFLLSDEARNITGQHLNIDCGVEFH